MLRLIYDTLTIGSNRKESRSMNKDLVIDDDKELCALMKKCVERENLSTAVAYGVWQNLAVYG